MEDKIDVQNWQINVLLKWKIKLMFKTDKILIYTKMRDKIDDLKLTTHIKMGDNFNVRSYPDLC